MAGKQLVNFCKTTPESAEGAERCRCFCAALNLVNFEPDGHRERNLS
jgi:hypothetical protein